MNRISESLESIRPLSMTEKSRPERSVLLGFVDLKEKDHSRPKPEEEYRIISVSSDQMESLPFPSSRFLRLDLDLYEFFAADLPDIWGSNEGLIKIKVDTRKPQELEGDTTTASFVTEFNVKDGGYAPSFLYRGVFRNVVFEEWVNLRIDLFELDTNAADHYKKIKSVIDDVPEMKNLDIFKGIPYLNLATKLFDGIVRTFGKNPDDHIWGEIPLLEGEPLIGGAFLRSGIYVLFEKESKKGTLDFGDIVYKNGHIICKDDKKELTNHLIFGARVKPYQKQSEG